MFTLIIVAEHLGKIKENKKDHVHDHGLYSDICCTTASVDAQYVIPKKEFREEKGVFASTHTPTRNHLSGHMHRQSYMQLQQKEQENHYLGLRCFPTFVNF